MRKADNGVAREGGKKVNSLITSRKGRTKKCQKPKKNRKKRGKLPEINAAFGDWESI